MSSPAPTPHEWLRFAEIEPFPGQWSRLQLTDEDLQALQVQIIKAPTSGIVVRGTGGLRKLRFSAAGSGQGKSGSYRVFYVYHVTHGIVILWAILAKGQSDNLSKADRNALAVQIARYQRLLDQGVIQ